MHTGQAYFIGGGKRMLESALYCLREGGFEGKDIHMLGVKSVSLSARALEHILREAGSEIRREFTLCALFFEEGAQAVVTAIRYRNGEGEQEIQLKEGDICVLDGEDAGSVRNLALLSGKSTAGVRTLLRGRSAFHAKNILLMR